MRFRTGANNENVASAYAALEALVNKNPVNESPQAQRDGDQTDRNQDDAAGNIFGVNQVESTGEKKAGIEACLNAEPLFMEKAGQAHRRIQMQPPTSHDQRYCEAAQQDEQDAHGASVYQRTVPESHCLVDWAGTKLVHRGQQGRSHNCDYIENDPESASS